ncbi:hypothetical protein BC828DRAFT_402484 [Blastocladiella britannica]|nr:hypothetical protein BC828DRAFT_402484 [Blastocladiella britannica]
MSAAAIAPRILRQRIWATAAAGFAGFTSIYLTTKSLEAASAAQESGRWQRQYDHWKGQRIGHYENRIRTFSHPFKIFQYFALTSKDGTDYMTAQDFIRSLQPYIEGLDHSAIDKDFTRIKTHSAVQFFKLADTDGDGLIDFQEYMIFTALLLIPEHEVDVAFRALDVDGNGVLSRAEFAALIDAASEARGYYARLGQREADSLSVSKCHGLTRLFFGPQGDRALTRAEFAGFVRRLKREVTKLEFYHLPVDPVSDTVAVKDAAAMVVGYAEPLVVNHLSDKLQTIGDSEERMAFAEFLSVAEMLERLDDVQLAIDMGAGRASLPGHPVWITRDEMTHAVKAVTGCPLNPGLVDVLFQLFETAESRKLGVVDWNVMHKVISHKSTLGLSLGGQGDGNTPWEWATHIASCTRSFLFS